MSNIVTIFFRINSDDTGLVFSNSENGPWETDQNFSTSVQGGDTVYWKMPPTNPPKTINSISFTKDGGENIFTSTPHEPQSHDCLEGVVQTGLPANTVEKYELTVEIDGKTYKHDPSIKIDT
ncbi:hypothetical protein [Sediminitomix flava]|uniref:Uncharacterized protein n=1 Tax=Sediminitomix flava TaxID=379075 RepID=A0A315Z542_SEDFL|nr:hypothetical protein [Sediminitomix flava]PWJ38003.1 hypothetical protein BC781_108138 [Sediminitomix flava]